ncbi:kinase-like domain-containing protein [Microdochium bolleyi]|uniref:Kinase-like domain-containing protein n=1 Tax=Microdochium bolleyi TaxID=196109 RepID=A0A136IK12_9PEZI|nr:kinase-like domain-containing protein [Microdochium bolleyi]
MSQLAQDESHAEFHSGSTIPFSSSSLVRRGIEVNDGDKAMASTSTLQDVPITSLYLDHQVEHCRLLVQPAAGVDLQPTSGLKPGIQTPSAQRILLRTRPRQGSGRVKCLAVRQGPKDIGLELSAPFRLDFFFDSQSDHIELRNRSTNVRLELQPLDNQHDDQKQLEPLAHERLSPGCWAVRVLGKGIVFQLMIAPRKHQVELVQQAPPRSPPRGRIELLSASGTKRTFSARIQQQSAVPSVGPAPPVWDVLKPINSLIDAESAQTVRVASTDGSDYTIFRMSNAGPSGTADVFRARMSQYHEQVIVVKLFKPTPSAETRAQNWAREVGIHGRLEFDHIVKLHGADARIDAIFLASINAQDLGRSCWYHPYQGIFCGTEADASCILLDMSRALAYLREERVLHNDIKPRNILYSAATGATLIDFGLGSNEGEKASSGGTPWYIPPEYFYQRERDAPADVWALGVVMLYVLKCMPLPELGKDVPVWQIRQIGMAGSGAHASMTRWLGCVSRARAGLAKQGVSGIVWRMLDTDVDRRISPDELVKQMQRILLSD